MQQMNSLFVNSRDSFIHYETTNQIMQRRLITCPHCGISSQAAGKVKNSWYILCPCGTYIQQCTSDTDYSD
jgi:hypothetical protein